MTKHDALDKVVSQYSKGLITPMELIEQIGDIYTTDTHEDCHCLACL